MGEFGLIFVFAVVSFGRERTTRRLLRSESSVFFAGQYFNFFLSLYTFDVLTTDILIAVVPH